MAASYDDGTIVCGPDESRSTRTTRPSASRRSPTRGIQGLQPIAITGVLSGKWRIWGTGNPRYWANRDWTRPMKTVGFVLDLGRCVNPIVTPDDPDAFESVIRDRAHLAAGNERRMRGPFI